MWVREPGWVVRDDRGQKLNWKQWFKALNIEDFVTRYQLAYYRAERLARRAYLRGTSVENYRAHLVSKHKPTRRQAVARWKHKYKRAAALEARANPASWTRSADLAMARHLRERADVALERACPLTFEMLKDVYEKQNGGSGRVP